MSLQAKAKYKEHLIGRYARPLESGSTLTRKQRVINMLTLLLPGQQIAVRDLAIAMAQSEREGSILTWMYSINKLFSNGKPTDVQLVNFKKSRNRYGVSVIQRGEVCGRKSA